MLSFVIPPVAPLAIEAFDLIWVVAAIAGWLVLTAGYSIYSPILYALEKISIFGVRPFAFLAGLITDGIHALFGQILKQLAPFGHLLWSLVMTVWRPLYVIVSVLQYLMGQIDGTNQAVAGQVAQAEAAEDAKINALRSQEQTDIADVRAEISGVELQLETDISQAEAASNTLAQTLYQQAVDYAQAGDHNAELYTDYAIDQATQDLGKNFNAAEQFAQGLFDRAESDLAQTTTVLEGKIANGVSEAEAFATGLLGGAGLSGLPQALQALQGQVNGIQTDIGECLDPLCADVSPTAPQLGNLGRLLQALEGLFGAAVLTGLLVAAVEDPKGTAGVVVDTAGWMGSLGEEMAAAVGEAAGVKL